jgi:hypothetical protein
MSPGMFQQSERGITIGARAERKMKRKREKVPE